MSPVAAIGIRVLVCRGRSLFALPRVQAGAASWLSARATHDFPAEHPLLSWQAQALLAPHTVIGGKCLLLDVDETKIHSFFLNLAACF